MPGEQRHVQHESFPISEEAASDSRLHVPSMARSHVGTGHSAHSVHSDNRSHAGTMQAYRTRSHSDWRVVGHSEAVEFFWAPPCERKASHEDEEVDVHEHWLELFIDLILVAFLSNLSHALVTGGPSPFNYWMKFQIYYLVLNSMHFISYIVNLLVIHDAATITLMFTVVTGIYLMANAMHTREHWPCKAMLGADADYVKSFYAGAIVSNIGELLIYVQLAVFLDKYRGFAMIHLVSGGIILIYSIVAVVILPHEKLEIGWYNSWYWYLHVTNFIRLLSQIVTAVYTQKMHQLNMSHIHARLGMLMVVNLGEWLIQILTAEHNSWPVYYCILQLFLCFGLALQIFNTRPHEIGDGSTTFLTPKMFVVHVHLHYILGFLLFLAGTSIDLEELVEAFFLQKHFPHSDEGEDHRRLGGGHGHTACTEYVVDGDAGWKIWSSMEFRSYSLGCTHMMVLLIRHFNKNIVTASRHSGMATTFAATFTMVLPGWKLLIRLCLATSHFVVQFVFTSSRSDEEEDPKQHDMMHCTVAHFVILLVSVTTDISIHRSVAIFARWLFGGRASRDSESGVETELGFPPNQS